MAHSRLYRLLLCAYPRDFREAYGAEMEAVFAACAERERRRGGRFCGMRVGVRAAADTVHHALQIRAAARRERRLASQSFELALRAAGPSSSHKGSRMHQIVQDLRYALRVLAKERSFTATVLLTLAICVGANAAIFAIVQSVLLRPLPVPEAGRLVNIFNSYPHAGVERASNGVPDYFDRLAQTTVFEELALFRRSGATLGFDAGPEREPALMVTPSFFRMLRVQPVVGSVFQEADGEPGSDMKVIISHGLWQGRFGSAPDVVGRSLRVNGRERTVVGVMPAGFTFVWPDIALWTPLAFTPADKSDERRHSNNAWMVGRLEPQASVEQAQQQIDAINRQNDERFPHLKQLLADAGFHTKAVSLQADLVRDIRPTLYLLWGGVLFVLLIGAVNITNLVVVRAGARQREMATRHALGAGYGRLVAQLLTETLTLAAVGGALGIALGRAALSLAPALGIDEIPRGHEIQMTPSAVAVVFAASLAVGLLAGLIPVFRLRGLNPNQALREEGRSGTASRRSMKSRRVMATAQVGLAFLLLITAGLLLASFRQVLGVSPGFTAQGLVSGALNLPAVRYPDGGAARSFQQRALERVRAIRGIERAALIDTLPFGGDSSDSVILAEGYVMKPGESLVSPLENNVSDEYFETMGIRLIAGRYFDRRDTPTSPTVIIVDRKLAERFWPGQNPVGRRMFTPGSNTDLTRPGPQSRWFTVVGVVDDVKAFGLADEQRRVGAYYFPMTQRSVGAFSLVARTSLAADAAAAAIRREIAGIDPELPFYDVRLMQERLDDSLVSRRLPMLLALSFGAAALFLAAIGIYGVLAYQVAQRTREIGIRMALGSPVKAVFAQVLRDGIGIVAAGLSIGLAAFFAASRYIESQLFGVAALDPLVMAAVAAVLTVVSLVAVFIPARRAARVNPLVALAGD